jgi:TPP-dependent 2-oxoacid decarboxylase
MGFGLPAAIAASLARPGRLGVALAGDGGFAMTMAELETAVRERAHVIALVFDNGRYGTIWRHQEQRGGEGGLATNLGPIDFAAVANAAGALGLTVSTDAELEPALRQAIEAGRPAVLHLALDPSWTTPEAAAGEVLPEPVAQAEIEPEVATSEALAEAQEEAIEEALVEAIVDEVLEAAVEDAVQEAIVEEAAAEEALEVVIEEAIVEEVVEEVIEEALADAGTDETLLEDPAEVEPEADDHSAPLPSSAEAPAD